MSKIVDNFLFRFKNGKHVKPQKNNHVQVLSSKYVNVVQPLSLGGRKEGCSSWLPGILSFSHKKKGEIQ